MVTSRKRTVEIDVVVDDNQAKTKLKGIGDTAAKSGKGFSTMSGLAKVGIAGIVGSGLVSFLGDATKAAAEDQRAQADLKLALQNTTGATNDQVAAAERYIDKTARATGVADDELRPALEHLARATGDLQEAQDLLSIAMDISAATGKPLQGVIEAMSKAIQNNSIGALGRLGLKIKDVNGDMLTFDEVMAEAQRTMGGAMATAAETSAGKMDRLAVAIEETKEGFGEMILLPVADWLADIFLNLDKAGDQNFLDAVLTDVRALFDETENRKENPAIQGLIDSFKALGDTLGIGTKPAIMAVSRETQDMRRLGIDPATGAIDDLTMATEDATGAIDDTTDATESGTDAFYKHREAAAKLADPVFALADAERDLDKAIDDAKVAAQEHGKKSPEYIEALGRVRDAAIDVQGAQAALGTGSGVTRAQMEKNLKGLGVFTDEQIDLIIADFERVNAFQFRDKQINIIVVGPDGRRRSSIPGGPGGILEHTGGWVPGQYRGQEVMVTARAGEFVSQSGTPPGHGGGGGVVVHVAGSVVTERQLVDVIRSAFIKDNRGGRPWG